MSKQNPDGKGIESPEADPVLVEAWHATARGPRSFPGEKGYLLGMDVLAGAFRPVATVKKPAPSPVQRAATIPVPRATSSFTSSRAATVPAARPTVEQATTVPVARPALDRTAMKAKTAKKPESSKDAASKAALKAVGNKANAIGRRLVASAKKLARRNPQAAKKVAAIGNRLLTSAKTTVLGAYNDFSITKAVAADAGLIDKMHRVIAASQALDEIVTLNNDVVGPLVTQADNARLTEISTSGNALMDRMYGLVFDFDYDALAESDSMADDVNTEADSIKAAAASWVTDAKAALLQGGPGTPGPGAGGFDPGQSGGGGGGGSDEDSGGGAADDGGAPFDESFWDDAESADQADATSRFRKSGGTDDPFYEDGGLDQGPGDDDGSFAEDGAFAEDVDPFSEEGHESTPEEDEALMEAEAMAASDMLGIDFKWQYLFMPHEAIIDAVNERKQGRPMDMVVPEKTQPKAKLAVDAARRITVSRRKLAAAQQRIAEMEKARAASASADAASAETLNPEGEA